jgi:hypothetical protein
MDRKTFGIAILTLTALILFVATLFPARPAQADFAVKDPASRLQLVTVTSQKGGNLIYLIDPVGGKVLVLGYNIQTRDLRAVAATTLDKVFP